MRIAIIAPIALILIGAAPYGQNPLPDGAASPAAGGACKYFKWGNEHESMPGRYWELQPDDVQTPDDPKNPNPGLWRALTDHGSWQPIYPATAIVTGYDFPFIVYVQELRGAVHIGCFSPGVAR